MHSFHSTYQPIMEQLRQRKKPLSTTIIKDEHSGLKYNYEDRLSKLKLFKTSILMLYLTLAVGYFSFSSYEILSMWIFDIYWYYYKNVRDNSNPNFLRDIYFNDSIVTAFHLFKGIVLFYIFKFIISKLLLTYDDNDELDKYN